MLCLLFLREKQRKEGLLFQNLRNALVEQDRDEGANNALKEVKGQSCEQDEGLEILDPVVQRRAHGNDGIQGEVIERGVGGDQDEIVDQRADGCKANRADNNADERAKEGALVPIYQRRGNDKGASHDEVCKFSNKVGGGAVHQDIENVL